VEPPGQVADTNGVLRMRPMSLASSALVVVIMNTLCAIDYLWPVNFGISLRRDAHVAAWGRSKLRRPLSPERRRVSGAIAYG